MEVSSLFDTVRDRPKVFLREKVSHNVQAKDSMALPRLRQRRDS